MKWWAFSEEQFVEAARVYMLAHPENGPVPIPEIEIEGFIKMLRNFLESPQAAKLRGEP